MEVAVERPNLLFPDELFDLLHQFRCNLNIMDTVGVVGHLLQQVLLLFGPDLVVTIKTGVPTT